MKKLQLQLEELYDSHQAFHKIKTGLENHELGFAKVMGNLGMDVAYGLKMMTKLVLSKRIIIEEAIASGRKHFRALQEASNQLERMIHEGFFDYDEQRRQLVVRFDITAEAQARLDMYQYPLPMVVPPAHITNNKEVGYLTHKGSIILRDNHHDDDVVLDHINRVNSIPLVINERTATHVLNTWRNLDKAKEGETTADFYKRKKAFDKWDSSVRNVIDILTSCSDHIYLTHKVDKRGRTYAQGYHISYQGNGYSKAIIEFYHKEYQK